MIFLSSQSKVGKITEKAREMPEKGGGEFVSKVVNKHRYPLKWQERTLEVPIGRHKQK